MKFYQCLIISIFCYVILLCSNSEAQTAPSSAPPIKLKAEFGEGQRCQKTITKPENCIFITLFKKFSMKCVADGFSMNNSLTLAWYYSRNNSEYSLVQPADEGRRKVSDGRIDWTLIKGEEVAYYTCKLMHKKMVSDKEELVPIAQDIFEVQALPIAVPVFKDFTVVEGNTLNVTCAIAGKADRVTWKFINTEKVEKILLNGTDNRVEMKPFRGVPDATVLIHHANATLDRGTYNCTAISAIGNSVVDGSSYVRLKGKYAALGPFLGICAEVIILCTIILIYEKKRDKTELEESDTDQGPETKSSPDHGQDSVRYRK
ncbi:basigin-like isoform X2 [Planococcus citri]|uniref:basigin-like isoform X2 n=1 Tax=Planococcus citri TaxID=170843 RepID=UPI0031F88A07